MQQEPLTYPCYATEDTDQCAEKRYIDLSQTVYTLCTEFPDLAPVLAEIGFVEIVKPFMLSTVGKVMTIYKGASLRKIDLETITRELARHGFIVVDHTHEEERT